LDGYYTYDEAHLALIPGRPGGGRKTSQHRGRKSPPSGKAYHIGDQVRVKLIRVNESKRALDFAVAEE